MARAGQTHEGIRRPSRSDLWTGARHNCRTASHRGRGLCSQAGGWASPLSSMAMLELLRGIRPGLTVHGFRSAFRDWAAEETDFPSEVVEMALAHTIESQVERAYRRGDLFQKRRALMEVWAEYCSSASEPSILQEVSDAA